LRDVIHKNLFFVDPLVSKKFSTFPDSLSGIFCTDYPLVLFGFNADAINSHNIFSTFECECVGEIGLLAETRSGKVCKFNLKPELFFINPTHPLVFNGDF